MAYCTPAQLRAQATLLLEEPYSLDGTFAGTGHSAVYLSRVCADSPTFLRRCLPGEKTQTDFFEPVDLGGSSQGPTWAEGVEWM
jgi:hypothetical protein